MTVSEIKTRLSKLEAMTEARGATRQEAATARRLAAQLRAKLPPEFNRQFTSEDIATHDVPLGESRSRRGWRQWEETHERQKSYSDWYHAQLRNRDGFFDYLKRGIKERDGILRARRG